MVCWQCSSVAWCLLSIYETLGSIPRSSKSDKIHITYILTTFPLFNLSSPCSPSPFLLSFSLLFFWHRISYSLEQPQTSCLAKADLELLIPCLHSLNAGIIGMFHQNGYHSNHLEVVSDTEYIYPAHISTIHLPNCFIWQNRNFLFIKRKLSILYSSILRQSPLYFLWL